MTRAKSAPETFRRRLAGGEHMVGTFIKTPTCHSIEILGGVGFDFVVIDEEHAPFDRSAIDIGLLAARAVGTAGLVRVAQPTAGTAVAFNARCPHAGCAVAVAQAELDCPCHGSRFDVNGTVLNGPAIKPLAPFNP